MNATRLSAAGILLACLFLPGVAVLAASNDDVISVEPVELLTSDELTELVGPVALYPDDLLAIVLPASTYPLQIVAAARYREDAATNTDLEPDESWDESVVALLNYPEVLTFLNDDIDWTWQLGQAVLDQQEDVLAAVQTFRDEAYAAGNLGSDERQVVAVDEDVVTIKPADPEVIHVPYYEPEEVTVYQTERVYHYYPTAYPVYYYPYSYRHRFYDYPTFWGVSSVFALSWSSFHLNHHYHSHRYHPFYGRTYHGNHFRRTFRYHAPRAHQRRHYRHDGDYHGKWQPRRKYAGARPFYRDQRHRDQRPNREHRRERHLQHNPRVTHRANREQRLADRSSVHRDLRREQNSVHRGADRSSVHRPQQGSRIDRQFRPNTQNESLRKRQQREVRERREAAINRANHNNRVLRARTDNTPPAVRTERMQNVERPRRVEGTRRVESTRRVERARREERPQRAERPQRIERQQRVERPQRIERQQRVERPQRAVRQQRVERPQRAQRQVAQASPKRQAAPNRSAKIRQNQHREKPAQRQRAQVAQRNNGHRQQH
ncbi:MAG: DUF3300 domain-containing protein [bacterium]